MLKAKISVTKWSNEAIYKIGKTNKFKNCTYIGSHFFYQVILVPFFINKFLEFVETFTNSGMNYKWKNTSSAMYCANAWWWKWWTTLQCCSGNSVCREYDVTKLCNMRVNFKRGPLWPFIYLSQPCVLDAWRERCKTTTVSLSAGLKMTNHSARARGRQATCVTDTLRSLVIYLARFFRHVAKSCRHRSFALRLPKCSSIYLAGALWWFMVLCYRPFCTWLLRISDFYAAITPRRAIFLALAKTFCGNFWRGGTSSGIFYIASHSTRALPLYEKLLQTSLAACIFVILVGGGRRTQLIL